MDFRPKRYIVWIASAVMPLLLVCLLYRQYRPDDAVGSGPVVFTSAIGAIAVLLLMRDRTAWQKKYIAKLPGGEEAITRAKAIGTRGLWVIAGSCIFLCLLFVWPWDQILYAWVAVFLIGMAMATFPLFVRWAIALGFFRP